MSPPARHPAQPTVSPAVWTQGQTVVHAPGARVLALDIGTSGARAVLFDLSGIMQGSAYQEYKSTFITPTFIDHNPATWLETVHALIPGVIKETGTQPHDVIAISVTSQRATIVPVDERGQWLAPAISWQDKRSLEVCAELAQTVDEEALFQTSGLRMDPYFSLPKVLWIRRHAPDVFRQTFKFLTVHDLVVHHLTGVFATDYTQASRTMMFDIRTLTWNAPLLNSLGLDEELLPEAYQTGTIAGGLTHEAAERLGLSAGTPVVMAGGDQQCATVGLGVIRPGLATVTTGTGSFVVAPVSRPVFDAKKRVLCSVAAVPNQWILEAGIFSTGAVYRWVRDEIADEVRAKAEAVGADPYVLLDGLATRVRPGSGGVLWLPHFAGSAAPYWNPDARGVIFNLTLGHSKDQLIRAALEGIVLEVNKNLAIIRELLSFANPLANPLTAPLTDPTKPAALDEIRVTGGAVRSDLFNQIQADVYGRRVIPAEIEEATALGAAVIGATAVGVYPDIEAACDAMSRLNTERSAEPDVERSAIYQELGRLHDLVYQALDGAGVYRLAEEISQKLAGQDESMMSTFGLQV